jgi:putative transposase
VLHLIRNTFRLAGRQHWERIARDLRPVYCAPNQAAAKERLVDFFDAWADLYPAVRTLWDNTWADFVPSGLQPMAASWSATPIDRRTCPASASTS